MSVYIIAEAGVNHNGDLTLAKKLVDEAKRAGADCVKFQTFNASKLVSATAEKADYQKDTTNHKESQLDMLRKLELTYEEFIELKQYCDVHNIDFMSTAFDLESIDFLSQLNMKKWKIPSGEITNLPYLQKLSRLKEPLILSTGMSDMKDIQAALTVLYEGNKDREITVLHCTTEYPTPFDEVNLKAMLTIGSEFNVDYGYSDHTSGIEVAIAAVALGASVIEKHFTLDREMDGPDHQASLEPNELKKMVTAIRNIEKSLGNGIKEPTYSEKKNMAVARKSIVANESIQTGDVLTEDNLDIKRPGEGISPMEWFNVIGTIAQRDFLKDEYIEL